MPQRAIPQHLLPFVAKQDPDLYTPIDHASWRFILRISRAFFAQHAHQKYLDGLKETGISTEHIPLISDMDQCLQRFGWRAVPVSGFIPPAVFLEFLSLGILPIACDMRKLEHLAYTPAPDIVHEAAGHAPIIADPEYAAYLRSYGEISRKAIFSSKDIEVYEAIRNLSDIKEDPKSTLEKIARAQRRLDDAIAGSSYTSEATQLARMSWWTIEYGLVGNFESPMIYGAGLLSSVGESYNYMSPEVRRVPLTLDSINNSYDITRPQPQLYVTPDFATLTRILEEFASTMAYKKGGMDGLAKAKMAGTVTTTELDSGIQISGILEEILCDDGGNPIFLRYRGPCQLANGDIEINEQGPGYHREGFSTPIGNVLLPNRKGSCSPAELTSQHLRALGFDESRPGRIEFESGISLEGALRQHPTQIGQGNHVLSFENCTVRKGDQILFRPEWGPFDLACGRTVVSVYGGAADRVRYLSATGGYRQEPSLHKTNLTSENRELNSLYGQVREIREKGRFSSEDLQELRQELQKISERLDLEYPSDWLLRMELLEVHVTRHLNEKWESSVREKLEEIAASSEELSKLIQRGMELL